MPEEGRAPEWDNFWDYYRWAKQKGYSKGDSVIRIDKCLPWGPKNCYVRETVRTEPREYSPEKQAFIDSWNRTVNRIRAFYGMPPLE